MPIKQLTDGRSYDPETLKLLQESFDTSWSIVGPTLSDNPATVKNARNRLAKIVLSIHRDGRTDPTEIAVAAVRIARQTMSNIQQQPTVEEVDDDDLPPVRRK